METEEQIKNRLLQAHEKLCFQVSYEMNASSILSMPRYAWKDNCWIKLPIGPIHNATKSTLKFVTYNIWFADIHAAVRWQALADLVQNIDPDFICFQEATKEFLELIHSQPWIREKYSTSDFKGTTFSSYGVVMLSKFPFKRLELHPFPSTMYRALLLGVFDINGEEVAVATAHLESLDMSHFRRTQLILASKILSQYKHVFFMGDFNFDATVNFNDPNAEYLENDNIKYFIPQYIDTWAKLHPDLPGFTFDNLQNLMIAPNRRIQKTVRYDRIMMKSPQWQPMTMEVIGNKEFTRIANQPIFPSDHFGLTAEFTYNNENKPSF